MTTQSIVVTDLRVDCGSLIVQVFPKAVHRECIFPAFKDSVPNL